jgi:hypothetical protein
LSASPPPPLPIEDLARDFLACTLPKAAWTHEAHLRVGAWHVDRYGATAALPRLRASIRSLNDSHGTANTPTGGYHETITAAYVRLIAEFLAEGAAALPPEAEQALDAKVGRLLASPLADRAFLLRFWTKERLMSPEARATWLEPDLAPLALTFSAA